MIIIVMGVTGVGKSVVGSELAHRLGCKFVDADDYHSPENINKMSRGIALTDEDRQPWLKTIHRLLLEFHSQRRCVVLACSALRQSYRDVIADQLPVTWIYLKSTEDIVREHLRHRQGHFAHEDLVHSQFETLEEPTDAITIDVSENPENVIETAVSAVQKLHA